jgi:hypothetical protein
MTRNAIAAVVLWLIVGTVGTMSANAASLLQKQFDLTGGPSTASDLSFTTGVGSSLAITDAWITAMEAFPSSKIVKITDGSLSFTTAGCFKGCSATVTTKGVQQQAYFNYGGSLTLTGEVPGLTSPVTLLTGAFASGLNSAAKPGTDQPFVSLSTVTHTGSFNGSLAITDINSAVYAAFAPLVFQVPSGTGQSYISMMTINLDFSQLGPTFRHSVNGIWNGNVNGTDILIRPVPEPLSLVLFATALFTVATLLRRKIFLQCK